MGNCLSPGHTGARNRGLKKTASVDSDDIDVFGSSLGKRPSPIKKPVAAPVMMKKSSSKENILGYQTVPVESKYELGRELGRGQFGITRVAKSKVDGLEYAVKCLPKKYMTKQNDIDSVNREIEILRHLTGHKNIVRYIEAFEDKENVHLVMELCAGGMLFDRITKRGYYSEYEAAGIMRTMVEIVQYMHERGVIHRDLKPENFLLSDDSDNAELKTIDFGLSIFFKPGQVFNELVGSAYYVAPEVLKHRYGPECDIWSAGVILYILLCGMPPFWHYSEKGIMEAVLKGEVDLMSDPWPQISEPAKDLVKKMLTMDPKRRITAKEILEHEWIKVDGSASHRLTCCSIQVRVKNFLKMHRLKQMAMHQIAIQLPKEMQEASKECFAKFETDQDDCIDYERFFEGLRKARAGKGFPEPTEEEVRATLAAADMDGDGRMDYLEFLAVTMHKNDKTEKEEWLRGAFARFDKEHKGYLTKDDVKLHCRLSDEQVAEIFEEVDQNQDGNIDYEEFVDMMKQGNGVDEILTFSDKEAVAPIRSLLGLSPSVIPRSSMEIPRPIEVAA
ncbi:calcium-dependent protein kinase [Klebsormidium nitens]|uniref:Calcium-dependent protein kinase n=1 Tax=Klebsormidium nitens TaxID=105231 RepID=A0A1Y1HMQ2_KLENI|nr:calcium-dependent protein kinase [Klebsormidium nitens]|eukprot:GAQ78469.1 calcium-dependent protein kinase [Klebsormidium nitens]